MRKHHKIKKLWIFISVAFLFVAGLSWLYFFLKQAPATLLSVQRGRLPLMACSDAPITDFVSSTVITAIGQTQTMKEPILYLGSFGYSISMVDLPKTNLYFDDTVKGIMFPLSYRWETAEISKDDRQQDDFRNIQINEFSGPYNDRRCLAGKCLELKSDKLYFNEKPLDLPENIEPSSVAVISIGSLSKRWFVGITLKAESGFSGQIYAFDGKRFTRLLSSEKITSPYFGVFGFGGDEHDFLVIYGAYDGLAYRVRDKNITNLSRFFNIRTMMNGFKPEVFKVSKGNSANWYVFSSTASHPELIKLWQNGTSEIAGVTVFANLFSGQDYTAIFQPREVKSDRINLLAKITAKDGSESWKLFSDLGFKNDFNGTLVTIPVPSDGGSDGMSIKEVVMAGIAVDEASKNSVKYLFSEDGQNWRNIPGSQNTEFLTAKIPSYYLKITYPPAVDKFYSPFVGNIKFDYNSQRF